MGKKINPIRLCHCFSCRRGSGRKFAIGVANRKFRHRNKAQVQKMLASNLSDDWNEILIEGGYTD